MSGRILDISNKKYIKPDGYQLAELDYLDGIESYGDIIFQREPVTFVLSGNRTDNIPEPSHRWFAVGNASFLKRGNMVLVDTVDGKSAIRKISQVDGRVLILKDPLNHLPKLGGDVLKVMGMTSSIIDSASTDKLNRRH